MGGFMKLLTSLQNSSAGAPWLSVRNIIPHAFGFTRLAPLPWLAALADWLREPGWLRWVAGCTGLLVVHYNCIRNPVPAELQAEALQEHI